METDEDVARRLLQHRKALFAYIFAIVRDPHLAEDVFQESSLVILKHPGPIRDFWALAREIARRQALSGLRAARRPGLCLSPEALDALDRGFDAVAPEAQARQEALRLCIRKLPDLWRRIVESRYWEGLSVARMSERLVRSANTLSVTLNRIRSRLADCVRQRLQESP